MSDLSDLYDTDYGEWARRNARLLRAGDLGGLDVAHLLEELDDRAKSERRELENRLTILLAHLLKWQSQLPQLSERRREFDGRSWRSTIIEQRDRLAKRLRETPSLKPMSPYEPELIRLDMEIRRRRVLRRAREEQA
jgi:hypothetical protein